MSSNKWQPVVRMVQESQCRWTLYSPKGHVLQHDITVSNVIDATRFVKNYVSSFQSWTYDVVPMKKKEK
jgi:hypothetical protein